MDISKISPGKNYPNEFNVIIEIPKGSRNKYEFDKELGIIKLDRTIYSPFFYPTDYGFIPGTLTDDGDPVDVLIITDFPTFPGCLVEARPLAIFKMIDSGELDDKILALPTKVPHYNHIKEISQISPHILKEIEHFFEQYKKLEGKEVKIKGWGLKKEAIEYLKNSLK